MQKTHSIVYIIGFLAFITGCGNGDNLAPVVGSVVIEGQPFTTGKVMFFPIAAEGETEAGRPAYGRLDEEGKFSMTTHSKNDGVLVGNHQVMIFHSSDESPYKFSRLPVPNGPFTVEAGENNFNIEITSDQIQQYKK